MSLHTAFTQLAEVEHPVALAPMGGCAGGALAAAVSNAGGIADGRGLAAALALGADGALVGTRFQASKEALVAEGALKAIVEGTGDETLRSRAMDIALGNSWPARYTGRSLRNPFLDKWWDKEDDLTADQETLASYRATTSGGDPSLLPVWASEAVDLIHDVPPAGEIVRQLVGGAEEVLRSLAGATR